MDSELPALSVEQPAEVGLTGEQSMGGEGLAYIEAGRWPGKCPSSREWWWGALEAGT
jgi:hypothetical protein